MACPTDILSTETQAERNKPQELSGEACSQLHGWEAKHGEGSVAIWDRGQNLKPWAWAM